MRNRFVLALLLPCVALCAVALAARRGAPAGPARKPSVTVAAFTATCPAVSAAALVQPSTGEGTTSRAEGGSAARPTDALRTPSADVAADPSRCAEWILALPDADLARLVNTPQLDRLVAIVLDGLHRAGVSEQETVASVSGFLGRLNTRILGVQPQ